MCAGELVAVATGHGGLFECAWGARGGRLRPGGEERERGTRQSESPSRAMTGALGRRSVRTQGEPERERDEGDDSVACCRRRGDLGGHEGEALGGRRRLEGGGYSAGAHCSALQSAQMAGMAIFYACGHDQRCLVALGGSKEVGDGLGCPGWPVEEERGRRRGREGLSREVNGGILPLNH